MKILFFNYEYPPLGGGAANATYYLMQEFSKIPEIEIDLVTSSPHEKYELEKVGENIKIHKLPIGKNGKNIHYQSQKELLIYAKEAYSFAKKLLKKKEYDLSHSFFAVPCGFLSCLLKHQNKLPYIVSLRGSDVPGYSERFSLIYFPLTPIIKHIWKKADFTIANSQGLKELALKSSPKEEIGVIYNGIKIDEFLPGTEKPTNTFNILSVCRLTERKGINYLIDAMEKILKNYSKARLVLAGEGDQMENLKTQAKELSISDQVKFLGRVSHEEISKIYQEAHVFVLPSLNEGMSNTMLEALSSGLPIVATDTGGTKELVTEGKNGSIIKMKDSDDIARKIQHLIKNPELRNSMGEESRKKAESMSWQKVAQEYIELYKKIISK